MIFRTLYPFTIVSATCLVIGCTTIPARNLAASKKSSQSAGIARLSSTQTPELSEESPPPQAVELPTAKAPKDRAAVVKKVQLSPSLTTTPESARRSDEVRFVNGSQDEEDDSEPAESISFAWADEPTTEENLEANDEVVPPLPDYATDNPELSTALPPAYPIDIGNVLYLVDAQNPNVEFARERIQEAYARVGRAEALWLPSIRSGLNYIHHEGNVQDVAGNVINVTKSSFYGGLGAAGGGSNNPAIPGVYAQFHLTDAIFQPKIAGHQFASRQFGATAARNDQLRNAAVAYLELVRAEQALAISEEALTNTQLLVRLTGNYARTGQGLRADYERMLAEQAVREADVVTRVEGIRVASARLAQVLHVDPSIRITSGEPMVTPLSLVDSDGTPASFVATGLARRPELAEQQQLVEEAVDRMQREKFAPLIPSVLLGVSYGAMGGGLGNQISKTNSRWDADALAFWEVRNFGVGEQAARLETASLIRQARQRELAILDQVAREVVETHAQVVERARRIKVARQGISAAERSVQLNEERIENAQGLPIESLQAVQALALARLTYLNAVIDHNIAQFELCRAIGWFENADVEASDD